MVAVAQRQAQQEPAGAFGDLRDEVQRELAAHLQSGGLIGGRVAVAARRADVIELLVVIGRRPALGAAQAARPCERRSW